MAMYLKNQNEVVKVYTYNQNCTRSGQVCFDESMQERTDDGDCHDLTCHEGTRGDLLKWADSILDSECLNSNDAFDHRVADSVRSMCL